MRAGNPGYAGGVVSVPGSLLVALCLLAGPLALGACTSSVSTRTEGRRITGEELAAVKPGVTTEDQLREMFGKPYNIDTSIPGKKTLIYEYSHYTTTLGFMKANTTGEQQIVHFEIRPDGVVADSKVTSWDSDQRDSDEP